MLRRHYVRNVARIVILVSADIGTFLLFREVIRSMRNGAVLGNGLAGYLRDVLPQGYLGGSQFVAALMVGLVFAGTYGRGDNRRNLGRLFGWIEKS